MNENVNNFLLSANKFILEIHLKKPRFTYSACGPLTANKEKTDSNFQTYRRTQFTCNFQVLSVKAN